MKSFSLIIDLFNLVS